MGVFILDTRNERDLLRGIASTELSESVIKSIIKCVVAVVFLKRWGLSGAIKRRKIEN